MTQSAPKRSQNKKPHKGAGLRPLNIKSTTIYNLFFNSILALQQEIMRYTAGMRADEYLFASRKGNDPITTTQAYRALVKAADMIDRNDIGTHTMRKTFGYHYYKRTKDIVTLMEIFNHSAPSITKRYIGITQDEIDQSLRDFLL
jgi:integrase